MKTAVIYQSKYGSTEKYAKWIAEDLGAELLVGSRVKPADLQKYDTIIYGGGLYAGGVNGISLLIKSFESIKEKQLYLFTVGAADVKSEETVAAIRHELERVMPEEMRNSVKVYHLRGGMLYSKLSFIHSTMMKMMIKMLRKKPDSELDDYEREMLASIGQDSDFTDRAATAQLVSAVRAGEQ